MALSNDELQTAYTALAEAAHDVRLDWVLEQVEERIAFGKTTLTKLSAKRYPELALTERLELDGFQEKRGSQATFVASEEYSPVERLELLIEALLLAVPTAHQIAQHTLAQVPEFGRVESMLFAPEVPTREPHEVRSEDLVSHTHERSVPFD
jgi:hypothetical protein